MYHLKLDSVSIKQYFGILINKGFIHTRKKICQCFSTLIQNLLHTQEGWTLISSFFLILLKQREAQIATPGSNRNQHVSPASTLWFFENPASCFFREEKYSTIIFYTIAPLCNGDSSFPPTNLLYLNLREQI